jgi:hypothetical protein
MSAHWTPSPAPEVSAALDLLVEQFSQPLAFLRELVQNSLDAGTNRVDVRVHHDAGQGCAVVEVADTGEGMDREIIDHQLTRLFASSKEGDFTKIGKFGIGFVSVFAVKPRAVVVDTGRAGQAWRVLFHPDRTFDRIVLDEPIDGTRVRVYVEMPRSALSKFRRDCRETLVFWCRHCEVEVCFDGVPLNQPFSLEAPYQFRHTGPGTEVVVAPSDPVDAFFGFYNQGLTLFEGRGSPLPGVSFKVRSRYLEHTLTRDQVLQDENHRKAMRVVEEAAFIHMPRHLMERLGQTPTPELWKAAALIFQWPGVGPRVEHIQVFDGLDSSRFSLGDLRSREGPCYSVEEDELARAATAEGAQVVLVQGEADPRFEALRAAGLVPVPVAQRWFLPKGSSVQPEDEALLEELCALLEGQGIREVRLIEPVAGLPRAVRIRALDRAHRRDSSQGPILALQAGRGLSEPCACLGRKDPNLAGFLLARSVLLDLEAGAPAGADLLERAVRRRRESPPARLPAPARRKRR